MKKIIKECEKCKEKDIEISHATELIEDLRSQIEFQNSQEKRDKVVLDIFRSMCIRNSSFNAPTPLEELFEKAKKLADIFLPSKE